MIDSVINGSSFNYWPRLLILLILTSEPLLTNWLSLETRKSLSLIYEIQNFANTCLEKVSKFQGNGMFHFGILSHLLVGGGTPSMNRVKGCSKT